MKPETPPPPSPDSCTAAAAARLAPYVPAIAANFEIARCVGKLIAAWDRPTFATPAAAAHMRPDDYVVGLVHKGCARAYPLWITDNYHIINDRLGGDPVVFCTCERCQSGSAFLAMLDGAPATFSALGMYNASLTMCNRRARGGEPHSLWLHYEGVAIDGPRRGAFLQAIPTFHMLWRDWLHLHPDSDVMLPPDDPHHRDARHGHGREEIFARPGMDLPLARTITGHLDHRYPEHEIVLGLNLDAGIRAWPLLEVAREGGVVNDRLGALPVVVFAGPRPDQITLAAYARTLDGRELTFRREADGFRDAETGSLWNIEGRATHGPCAGAALPPLRWQYVRWHAWVYPHPSTELFRSTQPLPAYPALPALPQVQACQPALRALADSGVGTVRLSGVIVTPRLPHEATDGVCLDIGGQRINVYRFATREAAQDWVDLKGAWFCWPFDPKLGRKPSVRLQRFAIESDPVDQYAEPTQNVRFPDRQVPWAEWLAAPETVARLQAALPDDAAPLGLRFATLLAHLHDRRIDVVEAAFAPHSQLRPGCESAVAATISGDRFLIYKCADAAAAERVLAEVTHAFREDRWVFRSIPVLMYAEPHYEMGMLPDERIAWSPLHSDPAFRAQVAAALRRENGGRG